MATRSLGVLTLDLIARTAGFVSGMTAAERSADKATKKIKGAFSGLKGAITGAIAGVSIAATIRAIVDNTIESENALRQLEARLKSTGGIAGVTSQELQSFAKELQGLTTFGDDAIIAMQGVLLTFTNIRGNTVKDATRSILDLSVAMGQDLQSSAVQVGKALNDPVKGITALSKIGVAFTAEQKELIKSFVAVGDVASAQAIILRELQVEFGGAAEAAADTFGGALAQLRNAFGDLLEVDGGLNDATGAVKELTELLKDPATIQAAQTLTSALITAFKGVTQAVTGTVNVVRFLGEEIASELGGAAHDDVVRLEEELEELEELRRTGLADSDFLNRLRFFGDNGIVEWFSNEDLDKAIKEAKAKVAAARELEEQAFATAPGVTPTGGGGGTGGTVTPPVSPVQEIRITIPKKDTDALAKFYEDLDNLTETSTEKALESYAEQREALEQLWLRGRIGVETYNARLEEINDELLPEFEVTVEKIKPVYEKAINDLNEFEKEAARNTQDIIADTLTGGFEDGADGVLKAFADMIEKLIAQAIAANIASYLFGEEGGGEKGSTGVLDSIFSAFAAYGGGKAIGGPVQAGRGYLVGERGPELIVPRVPGTVIPNHQLMRGSGGVVNQTINVSGTPTTRTARQIQIEAARQQRAASARLG